LKIGFWREGDQSINAATWPDFSGSFDAVVVDEALGKGSASWDFPLEVLNAICG